MPTQYSDVESELKDLIVANVTGYSADLVKCGDMDTALKTAFGTYADNPRFCVLNFNGGEVDRGSITFAGTLAWNHNTLIDFYIPMLGDSADVETRMRTVYSEFISGIADRPRCYEGRRIVPVRAFPPSVVEISSQHFINLRFLMSTLEQL